VEKGGEGSVAVMAWLDKSKPVISSADKRERYERVSLGVD